MPKYAIGWLRSATNLASPCWLQECARPPWFVDNGCPFGNRCSKAARFLRFHRTMLYSKELGRRIARSDTHRAQTRDIRPSTGFGGQQVSHGQADRAMWAARPI